MHPSECRDSHETEDLIRIFEKELVENNILWAWDYLDNERDSCLLGVKNNNSNEIWSNYAIIIQGPLENLNIVEMAIDRYFIFYPKINIIVSSWAETNYINIQKIKDKYGQKENFHIILSWTPEFRGYGGMNTNLQIISTIKGIRYAKHIKVKYVLKHRSDVVFGEPRFMHILNTHHRFFKDNIANGQKGRIIVGSMNSFRCRPFSISDHFSYGYIEDMELMWDLKLPNCNSERRSVNELVITGQEKEPMVGSDLDHLMWSAKPVLMDEAYLVSNLMKGSGNLYTADWKDSKIFVASCFIVMDTSSLNIFWNKYGWSISHSKYRHKSISNFDDSNYGQLEIGFHDWLEWYMMLDKSKVRT